MSKLGEICEHSRLKRSCNECDLMAQIKQLEAERDRLLQAHMSDKKIMEELQKDLSFAESEIDRLREAKAALEEMGND